MPEINEILSDKEITKLEKFNTTLQTTDKILDGMLVTTQKFVESLKSISVTIDTVKKAQTENNKSAKKLDATTRELIKLDKQMEAAEIKVTAAYKQVQKATIAKTEAAKASTKATRQEVLANSALKGSYNAISLSLSKNIAKFKALSETERETSKRGKELTATIKRQDAALKKLDAQTGRSQRKVGDYGGAIKQSAKSLLGALGLVGGVAALAAVLKSSFSTIVKFEKAQSETAAILRTNVEGIKDLTKASLEYGRVTKFTASEVSGLQKELAKLGFEQSEILASTEAILDLAAATESDLATAAKVAGSALRAFGLDATESGRVASVLAVATTKSALTFQDYEAALSNVAPVAKAFGFSIEETVALLGNLRDAGFEANKASVATRNILLNLADSGGTLAKALGGSVSSFEELIPALIKLREDGISLNETLELTDKRSVAAFNRFLEGAESAEKLRDGLIGVEDELQGIVDIQLDNLAGDMVLLASAWDGFVLSIGETGFARAIIQGLKDTVTSMTAVENKAGSLLDKIRGGGDIITQVFTANVVKLGAEAKKVFDTLDLFDFEEFDIDLEKTILKQFQDLGFNLKSSVALWDEYVSRRKDQNDQLLLSAEAAANAEIDAADKVRIEKEARDKISINKRLKEEKKASDEFLKESADFAEDELNAAADLDTLKFEQQVKDDAKSLEQTRKFLDEKGKEEKEAADESIKLAEEVAETKKELEQDLQDTRRDAIIGGIEAIAEFGAVSRENELIALEEEKNKKLAIAGDDADKRAKIEAEFAKKENDLRVKQAKAEKTSSLLGIAIKAAEAVFKIKATAAVLLANPLTAALAPLALAQIPFVIGSAAVQAALVVAQKVPKFHKGKKGTPDTFIAGDSPTGMAARELVITKGGESYMAETDTLFSGNKFKGATVHNNKETEAIMRASGGNNVNIINFDTLALQKSNAKGLKRIERAINRNKRQNPSLISRDSNYSQNYANRLQ